MAAPYQEGYQGTKEIACELDKNIVFEVLRRVDAVTLATASCVNWDFRSVSEEEGLWEKLCNDRWPSTEDSLVKSILSSVGGYRKVYKHCYPSIVNKNQPIPVREEDDHNRHEQEKASNFSDPSDFISIVDVVYGSQSVFSRIVEGIPGADDFQAWFSTCPFRIDLLRSSGNGYRNQGQTAIMTKIDLPSMTSVLKMGGPTNDSKFWNMLCDKLRVSWILINRKTKQMANLASWKPLGGIRQWLCDEDFLLRFGSVLPGSAAVSDSSVGGGAVQCNISLVCSLKFVDAEVGESAKATLRLTELSLQLEDFGGSLANGRDSIAILDRALRCPKSRNRECVMDSYHRYLKVRSELKAKNVRDEDCLNVAAAVASGIISCLFIFWLLVY